MKTLFRRHSPCLSLCLSLALSFCLFLACSCLLSAAPTPPVQLMVEGEWLEPATTLEVRFQTPMVEADHLGIPSTDSPLVITPAIAGHFTWLSTRSGVFVPDSAPPMGTTFTLTLKPDLRDAQKKPIPGKFKAVLRTAAFAVVEAPQVNPDADSLDPDPTFRFTFNRSVDLKIAKTLFRFVDSNGNSIPADVQYGKKSRYGGSNPKAHDWETRWEEALHPKDSVTEEEEQEEDSDEDKSEPLQNHLIVTPTKLLPPGNPWRLEMRAGLKSITGGFVLKGQTYELGSVQPFAVRTVTTSNYLNGGRSVSVEFNGSPGPDVTAENASRFLKVIPEPPNLKIEPENTPLIIRGDFDRDTKYRLEISKDLLSSSSLPISGKLSFPIEFEPVKPRVYLPEITGHQILGGTRKFPILSANLKSLRVRVIQIPAETSAQAIEAFMAYRKEYDPANPDEVFQALPKEAIKGKTIFEKEIALPSPKIDSRQKTFLDWDEILGAKKAGVLFLTVEGIPLDDLYAKQPAPVQNGKNKAVGRAIPVSKHPASQALIQLTDLGVLWKKDAEGLRTNVFSMATGKPLKETTLTLLNKEYKPTGTAKSDDSGEARLKPDASTAWLLLQNGEDSYVLRMGEGAQELPMAAFHLPLDYSAWQYTQPDGPPLRALIFTDRPLYRPGETVHIKGIVRYIGNKGLEAESEREGTLKVFMPGNRGEKLIKIRTDKRGSFDTDLATDPAATGSYSVALYFGDKESWQNGFRTSFLAADFQPNAFELSLDMADRFVLGTDVKASLTGRYLFGASLTSAHVAWNLQYSSREFMPEGFELFTFANPAAPGDKSLSLQGTGDLSAAGPFQIQPKLPKPTKGPAHGTLAVEVTDINQQTVSETRSFTRDSSAFYLGLKTPDEFVIGHKQAMPVQVIAVQADGQPLKEPVPVKIDLVRIISETTRVQGAGKGISFRTETREEQVASTEAKSMVPTRIGSTWNVPPGQSAQFTPGKAGQYRIQATAKDANGNQTIASYTFSVSGDEPISWDYRNPAQIDLVPNKVEYQNGDTAKILFKTPISGEALVTVERKGTILSYKRVHLEGNAPTVEIPIEASYVPNVFVSVTLIRGANDSTRKFKVPEYRYGVCQLSISSPATRLDVDIKPADKHVHPGQEIVTAIQVRDGNGAPAKDAEVTFYAIDDGILAITGYERPQPRPIFEAPFPLSIRTGLSLYELLPEDPSDLTYSNKGYLIGGGGVGGPGHKIRTDFPGTAIWLPSLRTDASGKLTVRFKAPDALTRYRLVAVAHAGSNQFGSGESAVQIRKPFLILSALGQGANEGDEILARAVLRNDSGSAGTAEITLAPDKSATPIDASLTRSIPLKDGESKAVDFRVKIQNPGTAVWQWHATLSAGGERFEDAMEAKLKIGSPSPVLKETYLTDLTDKSINLLDGINPQLVEGKGTVDVTLSNTRLAGLRQPAKALLEYPYGCCEQTVSTLIPWIVVNDLGPVLPDLPDNKEEISAQISKTVAKLFAQQTPSGGLAYWPGGHLPSLFGSAYAALAIGILQKQKTPPPQGWDALLTYLSSELRSVNQPRNYYSLDDAALALLALATAGKPEPAYHEVLFARRDQMSTEGRSLLACAIIQSKGKTSMVPKLLDPTLPELDEYSWFGSATRQRAISLLAWTWHKPADKEVARLVKEIMAARVSGHWRTTQENAWALLALSHYFKNVERTIDPVNASLVKGTTEAPVALTKSVLTKSLSFSFDKQAPLESLQVKNPATGKLYGETHFEVRPPVAAQPRQDRGYAVSRTYTKLTDKGSSKDLTGLKVGDRILVTLKIETTRPGHFVAIDDPLPALLEAINPAFRDPSDNGTSFWSSDYREIRSDRVLYFCDHLPAGSFTFQYLARVRTAGKVTAPATKVEEMYRPERFGLSATSTMEATAR